MFTTAYATFRKSRNLIVKQPKIWRFYKNRARYPLRKKLQRNKWIRLSKNCTKIPKKTKKMRRIRVYKKWQGRSQRKKSKNKRETSLGEILVNIFRILIEIKKPQSMWKLLKSSLVFGQTSMKEKSMEYSGMRILLFRLSKDICMSKLRT